MNPHEIDRPFEETMAECLSLLERIDELLGAIEPMSPAEARRTIPKRSAALVKQIADVCAELAIAEVGAARVDDMALSFDQAGTMRRVIERMELVLARLNASRMTTERRGWKSALTFYAVLQRIAHDDESLRPRIAPVISSFRRPRRQRCRVLPTRAPLPRTQ